MRDLRNTRVIWLKGSLFLLIAVVSSFLLWLESGSFKAGVLLVLTVWGFCRAYYFAFYVIEKYVDPGFRFAGLFSFAKYVLGKRGK